jgi:CheY-like chemotaxis protein/HPt (histidine-containing phosphotransfer) domain-containing protein
MSVDDTPPNLIAPLRILLAEDNESNQAFLIYFLQGTGHLPTLARDGREVLALLAHDRFDLILMDIQMPGLDGLEATRRIRAGLAPGTPTDIPIIALTAYAMLGDRERFLAAGMDGYVAKPVALAELTAEMARVLRARTAPPAASPADVPAIDVPSLLFECADSSELVARLFATFIDEARERLADLDLAGDDPARLAQIAHSLANSAGALRAWPMLAAARGLEQAATSGQADLATLTRHLATQVHAALDFAAAWLA